MSEAHRSQKEETHISGPRGTASKLSRAGPSGRMSRCVCCMGAKGVPGAKYYDTSTALSPQILTKGVWAI